MRWQELLEADHEAGWNPTLQTVRGDPDENLEKIFGANRGDAAEGMKRARGSEEYKKLLKLGFTDRTLIAPRSKAIDLIMQYGDETVLRWTVQPHGKIVEYAGRMNINRPHDAQSRPAKSTQPVVIDGDPVESIHQTAVNNLKRVHEYALMKIGKIDKIEVHYMSDAKHQTDKAAMVIKRSATQTFYGAFEVHVNYGVKYVNLEFWVQSDTNVEKSEGIKKVIDQLKKAKLDFFSTHAVEDQLKYALNSTSVHPRGYQDYSNTDEVVLVHAPFGKLNMLQSLHSKAADKVGGELNVRERLQPILDRALKIIPPEMIDEPKIKWNSIIIPVKKEYKKSHDPKMTYPAFKDLVIGLISKKKIPREIFALDRNGKYIFDAKTDKVYTVRVVGDVGKDS